MNDLLVCNAIQHADIFVVSSLGACLVACFNCLDDLLDCCAQCGTQTCVVSALIHGLASTFSRLCGIGHMLYPEVCICLVKNNPVQNMPGQVCFNPVFKAFCSQSIKGLDIESAVNTLCQKYEVVHYRRFFENDQLSRAWRNQGSANARMRRSAFYVS